MRFTFLLGVLLATSWLLAAAPVQAEDSEIEFTIAGPGEVGTLIEAVVTVKSSADGAPVPGATVALTMLAEFGGQRSFVILARSVTGPEGVATLRFEPRITGEHELRAEILLPGETKPLIATATVTIAQSDEQQFRAKGGIRIFGHEWIIIGVVSAIWFVLFLVALGITDIARAGAGFGHGPGEADTDTDTGEEVST